MFWIECTELLLKSVELFGIRYLFTITNKYKCVIHTIRKYLFIQSIGYYWRIAVHCYIHIHTNLQITRYCSINRLQNSKITQNQIPIWLETTFVGDTHTHTRIDRLLNNQIHQNHILKERFWGKCEEYRRLKFDTLTNKIPSDKSNSIPFEMKHKKETWNERTISNCKWDTW